MEEKITSDEISSMKEQFLKFSSFQKLTRKHSKKLFVRVNKTSNDFSKNVKENMQQRKKILENF